MLETHFANPSIKIITDLCHVKASSICLNITKILQTFHWDQILPILTLINVSNSRFTKTKIFLTNRPQTFRWLHFTQRKVIHPKSISWMLLLYLPKKTLLQWKRSQRENPISILIHKKNCFRWENSDSLDMSFMIAWIICVDWLKEMITGTLK